MQPTLVQGMEQRLLLLPSMLQSIEVLQLARQDLLGWLEQELASNAVLELSEPAGDAAPAPSGGEAGGEAGTESAAEAGALTSRLDVRFDEERIERSRRAHAGDDRFDPLANAPAPGLSLQGHLLEQIGVLDLAPALRETVSFLIGNVDRNGFLMLADDELAAFLPPDAPVADALAVLRSLDPRGVGGRDVRECLLLQLDAADRDAAALRRLVQEHLEDLARNRLPQVARALGVALPEVVRLLDRIRDLRPWPGLQYDVEEPSRVQPDVIVQKDEGRWLALVDDQFLPRLQVNPDYERMLADRGAAPELRDFLRDKMQSARGLMFALAQRRLTLTRVAQAVVDRQREFLERGTRWIQPMKMQDVADALAIHVSTVSRAIAGKWMQTPRGMVRIRDLFDGGAMAQADPGTGRQIGASRTGIKEEIRALIEREDRKNPLSDDQICDLLRERGLQIARRTVAKYRGELGIAPVGVRREF